MQVIEYIKQHGTEKLTEELGISVKRYDDERLMVLNYNQIESPKTHPLVIECRSLILDYDLNVVSRGFDRFFNLGEALNVMPEINWTTAECVEKVDGSLIKIYHYKGVWYISTRGTAFAESDCMGFGVTFRELVLKALGESYGLQSFTDSEFQHQCRWIDPDYTYIFELTSVENRVVKHYDGYTLHFLAARNNATGDYGDWHHRDWAHMLGASQIKAFRFSSEEEAVKAAAKLQNLDEGFIVYQNGVPIAKIKSPTYVAVHHIRGEGLNPKRISELVLNGEVDEYLTYFPNDEAVVLPYLEAYINLMHDVEFTWLAVKDIVDQKEFALAINKYKFKPALFNARQKRISVRDSFDAQRDSWKIDLLKEYVK